jgi:myo-inositol-1(or 4)-monophosphatase
LQVSGVDRLEDALLCTGFPPNTQQQERLFAVWKHLSHKSQSLRRTGSTAINLAYLAAGRFDGYWAFDNHVWDVAAGVVLVREAGGVLSNADGTPYDPYRTDCVASNGKIQGLLLEELRVCEG